MTIEVIEHYFMKLFEFLNFFLHLVLVLRSSTKFHEGYLGLILCGWYKTNNLTLGCLYVIFPKSESGQYYLKMIKDKLPDTGSEYEG